MHKSVLLNEVLEGLAAAPGMVIVDGTLGLGGHAQALLEKVGPKGQVIGFDRDPDALAEVQKRLERFGEGLMVIHDNFRMIKEHLAAQKIPSVDGILLDLGVSSLQLDNAPRGFSFRASGPLDMRMDPRGSLSAKEVVNRFPKRELEEILRNFGEERFARRIAERIALFRDKKKIETTEELVSIVLAATPKQYHHRRIHPATKTFQALRIAVNEEMKSLEDFLKDFCTCLRVGGRAAIISFHSLEDRMIKHGFRKLEKEGRGKVLTRKPITPSDEEARTNPRSRSAKLRVFEKTHEGVQ